MSQMTTPENLLNSVLSANPSMKEVGDVVRKNNGNYQAAFYEMAKNKGINPDDIIGVVSNIMK